MRASTLLRLSGGALMLALPAVIVGGLTHPRSESVADILGGNQVVSHAIYAFAMTLILLGLPGLYAAHAERSGLIGLFGFVAMMLFAAYHVYMLLYEAGPVASLAKDPAAERLFADGGIVDRGTLRMWLAPIGVIAPILYGVALSRARLQPRWSAWLVIAFVPAFVGLTGLAASLPPETRDSLLDLSFAPISIALSYGLLLLGLAIPGSQLWRNGRLSHAASTSTA